MSAPRPSSAIISSDFSITAWRLAELYRAAGVNPSSIAVLERGRRYGHTDFRQSMDIDHLSDVYLLIQGQGGQVVTATKDEGADVLLSRVRARIDRHEANGKPTALLLQH